MRISQQRHRPAAVIASACSPSPKELRRSEEGEGGRGVRRPFPLAPQGPRLELEGLGPGRDHGTLSPGAPPVLSDIAENRAGHQGLHGPTLLEAPAVEGPLPEQVHSDVLFVGPGPD